MRLAGGNRFKFYAARDSGNLHLSHAFIYGALAKAVSHLCFILRNMPRENIDILIIQRKFDRHFDSSTLLAQ